MSFNVRKEIANQSQLIKFLAVALVGGGILTFWFYGSAQQNEQDIALIKALEMDKNELARDNDNFQAQLRMQAATINELREALRENGTQTEKLKSKLNQKEELLSFKGEEIDIKQGNIRGLTQQINSLADDKDRLHDIIEAKSKEIQSLSDRNKEQNEIIQKNLDQIATFQKELSNTRQDLEEALKDQKLIADRHSITQDELKELKGQLTTLLSNLSDTKSELNRNKIALSDAETELRILKEYQPYEVQKAAQQAIVQTQQQAAENSSAEVYRTLSILGLILIIMLVIFVIFVLQQGSDAVKAGLKTMTKKA